MLQPGRAHRCHLAPLVWGVVACVLAVAPGCARPRPAAAPVDLALDVPPAPPRVISTPPEPVAPTEASTVERPAPAARPQRTARGSSTRAESPRPAEPARAEGAVEAAAPVATPEPPAAPAPLLRTPQTADESNAERRTQEVLARASGLLDRVDQKTLGAQARQQHETARRFVVQAKQALTERNFVLASYLADKAETLAKGLSR
ncbi:hypothetical protein TBR22_A44180 [Luteitalea sp. TBR-22]|uniref:hypothetical protein n=1 Tax=Luteitalea sp. TBR-22 TaxID=2802971 RepID=UPI001AF8EF6A|nr:hypothetical protein [Luteitalea sp. TBR-22]BCS35191.1 hypothetical protein TBR22_A44180 [Luteitalea sp. TBR-22]